MKIRSARPIKTIAASREEIAAGNTESDTIMHIDASSLETHLRQISKSMIKSTGRGRLQEACDALAFIYIDEVLQPNAVKGRKSG